MNDVLKKDLENTSCFFIDETTDPLNTSSPSKTTNCKLGHTLDVISQHLPVRLLCPNPSHLSHDQTSSESAGYRKLLQNLSNSCNYCHCSFMAELTEAFPSALSSGSFKYDVFISYRQADTSKNFTGFLHKALTNVGINAFIDGKNLWFGEAMGPALENAIKESNIWIPVFSSGYLASK
ncbi:hypothetical protein NE237_000754 [Protea cynaroides]|uniref:ADP-ribosyl cyclase/cyclic ADP-ribose hydrolase n=1 Tax=Protea cynaroides TaxID=273540 RepID=A0A9Q0KRS4_9MAGN|nr:hypothetical protein NE237_000754 [Protea cynaroides]